MRQAVESARMGWGLIATLFAVFPANLNLALHPVGYMRFPRGGLYGGLRVLLLFAAWVRSAARS
jgi:uncharacterized membrane protein